MYLTSLFFIPCSLFNILILCHHISTGTNNQQNSVINTTQIKFNTNPALSILPNLICPLANTIALGGVPIGSIQAQLAPSVMGIPNSNGLICKASATADITGAITITWAILLVTSLRNTEMSVTTNINTRMFPVAKEAM